MKGLGYHWGEFEVLVGLLALGLATVFLRFQLRMKRGSGDPEPRLRLMAMMLVGAIMVLLSRRGSRARVARRP